MIDVRPSVVRSTVLGLVLCVAAAGPPGFAEDIRTVEVVAEVYGADRTPAEAKREALQRARDLAVAEVAGVQLKAQQLRLKSEQEDAVHDAFSYLVHTSTQGRIVKEEVAFETRIEGGVPIYRAVLRAEVALEQGTRDAGFQLDVQTLPDSPTLREGEPLTLVLTPSQDCYVTVLNLRADGGVVRIFPNQWSLDHGIPGGQATRIPGPDDGFEIRVTLGPGRRRQQEQILVVATVDPLTFRPSGDRPAELVPPSAVSPGLSTLNQWLLQVPVERRTEALLAYEVVE